MEEYTFLAPLLLTIGGLIIGAILKSLLKHSRLPYTVGLFAIGIILGVMNRTGVFQSLPELHDAVSSVANINPDLILYLFLPILIFDAAYELNLHIFKRFHLRGLKKVELEFGLLAIAHNLAKVAS